MDGCCGWVLWFVDFCFAANLVCMGCCGLFSLLVLFAYFVAIDPLCLLSVDLVCGCCCCGLFTCVWVSVVV